MLHSTYDQWPIGCALLLLGIVLMGTAPPDVGNEPDADFLEFLGSWQMGEDRWVDPFTVPSEIEFDHKAHPEDTNDPLRQQKAPNRELPDRGELSQQKSPLPAPKVSP